MKIKSLFALLFALLLTVAVHAQVAFDAVSSNTVSSNTGTTLTWTHTPVGTPTAVAVEVMNYNGGPTVSSVKYGSATLTQAVTQAIGTSSVAIYCVPNPPSGAQTVTITFSGTGSYTQGAAITVTGSNTSTCFDGTNSAGGTGTAATVTVTGGTSNDLVVDMVGNNNGQTATVGGGQTSRFSNLAASANETSGSTKPGASSVTMSWTIAASSPWGEIAASFEAAGSPPPSGAPTRSLLGVGQ